jgi:hypothetical protein
MAHHSKNLWFQVMLSLPIQTQVPQLSVVHLHRLAWCHPLNTNRRESHRKVLMLQ